jgi:tetratricopeptide (TPR) repeat protein
MTNDKALDLDPKNVYAYYNKGNTLRNLDRYEEALVCYEKALNLNPKYVHALFNKGFILENLDRWEEAIAPYQKTLEIDPNFTMAWIALARLYRKLDRKAESAEQCKMAFNLIEKENEYTRACFEAVCGSADAALALLRTALKKKEQTADFARQDLDFEFIRDDPRFSALLDELSEDGKNGPK